MDELRVVRREEGSLILANELGEEYRFVIDEEVAQDVRQATRRTASAVRVRPREIQALLRAGKTRAEVAGETGLDEADVERFEEPVRAEQRYMLDLSHGVTVRTDPAQTSATPSANEDEQRFGQVISERLIGLGNTSSTWRSWRDEEAGWLIGLAFDSRDGDHDAVWSFDHKKRVLSPLTPDATNLSKLGEVGDRLIPKLRAVDNEQRDRFESGAFDPDALLSPTEEVEPLTAAGSQGSSRSGAGQTDADGEVGDDTTPLNADAEYERRREIDHLAVNTPADGADDLSQTADLLDALRRRRGERSLEAELPIDDAPDDGEFDEQGRGDQGGPPQPGTPGGLRGIIDPGTPATSGKRSGAAANIWGTSGVSGTPSATPSGRGSGDGEASSGGAQGGPSQGGQGQSAHPALRSLPGRLTGAQGSPAGGGKAQGDSVREPGNGSGNGNANGDGPDRSDAADGADDAGTGGDTDGSASKRGATKRGDKRGRSSIPSWDDILFGTRSDDDPA